MNDDLHRYLGAWRAPAPTAGMTRRITALFDDQALPGPVVRTSRRGLAVPLVYAAAVAALVLMTAPRPRDAPSLRSGSGARLRGTRYAGGNETGRLRQGQM